MRPISELCDLLQWVGLWLTRGRQETAAFGGERSLLLARGSIRTAAFHRVPARAGDEPAAEPVDGTPESPTQTVMLSDVSLVRGNRPVLCAVDVVLVEHRIGILGLNGSGKSSLLKLMVGLLVPTSGLVRVDGLDPCTDAAQVRSRTGFLFQCADNQIVYPVVREDLAFGLAGLEADVDRVVVETLASLGIADLADRRIHELSGGERQLVALAGVLARGPLTILFDEPTSQLDLANRNRFHDVLAGLPQQAIVVTHDLDLVADFDRVLVFEKGRIVCDAAPDVAIDFYRRSHR